ncbi:hypothetical protein VTI74DRAFT_7618 [Chaetomium olivicolor]
MADTKSEIMPRHLDHEKSLSLAFESATKNPDVSEHSGTDQEIAAYAGGEAIVIDDETNKRLFWTVNRRILLYMLGTYFCQSLDKGILGFASIMGIIDDAKLEGQQFSWLGTSLYMGVLFGEYPTNVLLQKLPVAKYLAANIFCWGVVIACSAAARNFGPLMAVRFLLGTFESCVQPAFIIITSMWWRREEQSVLTSLWYCMTGVQLMVGGLIAYGASHYDGSLMKSWQMLFLVLGVVTCVWGAFAGWFLPDSPMKAKCFDENTKRLLIERVRANETGIQNKTYKRYQIVEALTDPVTWCYVLLQVTSTLIIGGLGVFSNLIIRSFGFALFQTQLLNIAQGAVTIIVMISAAWTAQRWKQTALTMHLWSLPAIAGTAIIFAIPPNPSNRIGLLIAFYCTQFFLAQGNLIFSLISRNVAGQSKKSMTLTICFVGWAAGNMTAPQIFQAWDAPRYRTGFTAHFCLYALFNIILAVMRFLLTRRNTQKPNAAAAGVGAEEGDADAKLGRDEHIEHRNAFADLTDKENPDFRYVF